MSASERWLSQNSFLTRSLSDRNQVSTESDCKSPIKERRMTIKSPLFLHKGHGEDRLLVVSLFSYGPASVLSQGKRTHTEQFLYRQEGAGGRRNHFSSQPSLIREKNRLQAVLGRGNEKFNKNDGCGRRTS